MFFKSDRGVRCAIERSRSVYCDGVFFATIFFATVFLFVLVGQATKEWETRSVWCDGVFLRRYVFAMVCFFAKVCVSATRCLLRIYSRIFCNGYGHCWLRWQGVFLRHCVCCTGRWALFASIKNVSCTVKLCFCVAEGFLRQRAGFIATSA